MGSIANGRYCRIRALQQCGTETEWLQEIFFTANWEIAGALIRNPFAIRGRAALTEGCTFYLLAKPHRWESDGPLGSTRRPKPMPSKLTL